MVTRRNLPDKAHFLQEIRDQYTQGENKASKCEPFGSPLSRVCLTEALADVSVGCVHLAQYSYSPFTTKCRFVQVAKSHFTAGVLSMAAKHYSEEESLVGSSPSRSLRCLITSVPGLPYSDLEWQGHPSVSLDSLRH